MIIITLINIKNNTKNKNRYKYLIKNIKIDIYI